MENTEASLNTGPSFHDLAMTVFATALATARDGLLRVEDPLDLEDQASANWLPHDKDRYLDYLADRPPSESRLVDIGDPQIQADSDAHKAVVARLHGSDLVGEDFCLVGEEAPEAAWGQMQQAPPGTLILVLDAIDGSGPYQNLTFGYGTTLLALRRRIRENNDPHGTAPHRDILQGAAVCNSSGYFVSMSAADGVGAEVLAGSLWDDRPLVGLASPEYPYAGSDSLAVVAAKPEARNKAACLLAVSPQRSTIVYNLGGAPACLGLLLGRLGALVSLEYQTMWDAAYLPILAALGLHLFLIEGGTPFGVETVTTWFSYLTHEKVGVRPVPPFVAARRVEDAGELLRIIKAVQ